MHATSLAVPYQTVQCVRYNPPYLNLRRGSEMDGDVEITLLLRRAQRGDAQAESLLLELLHRELRHMAAAFLARERINHTLQATALVNEAYLRLGLERDNDWESRTHFMGAAAQAMRHVL